MALCRKKVVASAAEDEAKKKKDELNLPPKKDPAEEAKKADKAVILVGWGVAAAVNCQVAAMEPVSACVCLGFPMFTIEGARGDADDPILDLRSHVLFVIGEVMIIR